MRGLLAGLVAASLSMGLISLAWHRRGSLAMRAARIASLIPAGLSLLLLWQVGSGSSVSVTWIPEIEPASLDLSAPGIYLAVMTFWSLALTLNCPVERSPPKPSLWAATGIHYLLCGLVVAALTLDQFLARYASIEIVVLGLVLVILIETDVSSLGFPIWRRYLELRLGDAGLMLAILLLYRLVGTFKIEEMLAAAADLPISQQVPILLGGVLAAWVKLGLPPLHGWLLDSAVLSWKARTWLQSTALPVLGAYLLYRLSPLIAGATAVRGFLAIAGLLILVWALRKAVRDRTATQNSWILIAHGALGLLAAGTTAIEPYLLTFIPIRLGWCLLAALWLRQPVGLGAVKLRPISDGPGVPGLRVAGWAEVVELRGLEGVNHFLEHWTVRLACAAKVLEWHGLEGCNRSLARLARRIGLALQARHTGQLRRNMLWVSVALLVSTVAALMVFLV